MTKKTAKRAAKKKASATVGRPPTGRNTTVMSKMWPELGEAVDVIADDRRWTRSAAVAELLREYVPGVLREIGGHDELADTVSGLK